jgi:ABC-type transport system involved in multi-copper enzyme maturation permease subunit
MKKRKQGRQRMLNLIRVEFFKLRKRWMPYVLLLVLLASILIPLMITYINYQSTVSEYPNLMLKEVLVLPTAMEGVFNSVPGLGMILVAILAASVVGNEYGWGTLRQTLVRGTSRTGYLTSKLLSIAIIAFIGVIIAVATGLIATIITSMLVQGGIEWGSFFGYFIASLGRTLLVLIAYISMATFFSVLLRSSGLGIMVTIAWFIGDSIIVGLLASSTGWLADISQFMIGFNTTELLALNSLSPPNEVASWWQSAGVLLAYSTVFIAASYYRFQRQDLTA